MDRQSAHDPRAIANRVLDIRSETGTPFTIMQLIKIIYIADGWALALLGKPLSNENPEAWQYGPVYPTVYRTFSGIGARPVEARAYVSGTTFPIAEELPENEEKLLKAVVDAYGKLSAYQLSELTHQPGTPWSKAYDKGPYTKIDIEDMRSHYESLKANRLGQRTN